MAVYVNTNYSALQGQRYLGNVQNSLTTTYQRLSQGQRYLGNVQNSLTTTYQRLSSGMRINSAKDDAAGLQIADRLTSQINGLNQGNRNAADGIALAQTIEAGMDEMSGMLQKIRTLAVQASNGTNTLEDRKALSKEASALANEISRIADQTTFAGKKILKGFQKTDGIYEGAAGQNAAVGSTGKLTLQVGSNKGDTISFEMRSYMFSMIASAAGHDGLIDTAAAKDKPIGIDGGVITIAFTEAADNQTLIEAMDGMIAKVDAARADLGAIQNRSRTV